MLGAPSTPAAAWQAQNRCRPPAGSAAAGRAGHGGAAGAAAAAAAGGSAAPAAVAAAAGRSGGSRRAGLQSPPPPLGALLPPLLPQQRAPGVASSLQEWTGGGSGPWLVRFGAPTRAGPVSLRVQAASPWSWLAGSSSSTRSTTSARLRLLGGNSAPESALGSALGDTRSTTCCSMVSEAQLATAAAKPARNRPARGGAAVPAATSRCNLANWL